MSSFTTIDYVKHNGGIAVLTLNRPKSLNAFNVQMRDEIYEVLTAVRDDPDVRGMLVTGAGDRAFCAGADLTEFGSVPSQAIARQVRFERDIWRLWLSIPKPMVAAIHGYCLGSGIEVAAVCDIRIAADDTVFGMPEVAMGLIPAAGGTQLLPRLVGTGRALDLLLTGRQITAVDSLSYGLVTQVVTRDNLKSVANHLLSDILRAPSSALTAAKRAIVEGLDLTLPDAVSLERRISASLAG